MNDRELPTRRSATPLYIGLGVACAALTLLPLALGPQFADSVDALIVQAQRGHIGLPVAILFFTLASFIGAPQPLLVGACVLAAGPLDGFWFAWAGTTVAGLTNYVAGHACHDYARERIDGFERWRWMHFIRRKPFLASLFIRFVPTAPFVVVNMAFGAARANYWGFLAGLALGSLPKTALNAFAGKGVLDAVEGDLGWSVLVAVAAVALWFALGLVLCRRAQKLREESAF